MFININKQARRAERSMKVNIDLIDRRRQGRKRVNREVMQRVDGGRTVELLESELIVEGKVLMRTLMLDQIPGQF